MTGANLHDECVLICDCDGVLIDSEAVAARVLVAELSARWPGVDVERAVMPRLGLRIERVLEASAHELGRVLSAQDVAAIRRVVEAAAQTAPMFDGVEAALAQIDLPKACASNSYTDYVQAVLARTGLVRFFGPHVFCADTVERPKPAPDVYLAAARAFRVTGAACLVVEDSVTGVTAARAAGMAVLGFVGGGHASEDNVNALRHAGAQDIFDDMSRLPALVNQWLAERAAGVRRAASREGDESWRA